MVQGPSPHLEDLQPRGEREGEEGGDSKSCCRSSHLFDLPVCCTTPVRAEGSGPRDRREQRTRGTAAAEATSRPHGASCGNHPKHRGNRRRTHKPPPTTHDRSDGPRSRHKTLTQLKPQQRQHREQRHLRSGNSPARHSARPPGSKQDGGKARGEGLPHDAPKPTPGTAHSGFRIRQASTRTNSIRSGGTHSDAPLPQSQQGPGMGVAFHPPTKTTQMSLCPPTPTPT